MRDLPANQALEEFSHPLATTADAPVSHFFPLKFHAETLSKRVPDELEQPIPRTTEVMKPRPRDHELEMSCSWRGDRGHAAYPGLRP
jgi:hypothetical protein